MGKAADLGIGTPNPANGIPTRVRAAEGAAWATCAASSSAASCRFHLFLLFWNQVLTCVSLRCRLEARHARSALLRYRLASNADSSWNTWLRENTVRVFFFPVSPLLDLSSPALSVRLSLHGLSDLWSSLLFLVLLCRVCSFPSDEGLFTGASTRHDVEIKTKQLG